MIVFDINLKLCFANRWLKINRPIFRYCLNNTKLLFTTTFLVQPQKLYINNLKELVCMSNI